MCEDALVAAAKQGQAEAFATLCQPYARRLIRNAHRITRNHEDAEHALQDAFLSAFIHIKNFDGRSSFSTWLTRIAINSALMTLRKKRSSRETSIGFGESDAKGLGWDVPDPSPNPEKACAQREKERLLREAICDLRQTIRRVVEIQQVRELSMKETARMDGRLSDSGEGAAVSRETGTEESIAAKNKRARVTEQLSSTRWLHRMHMNDLLSAAVNAHGGLSRWRSTDPLARAQMQHQSRIQTQKRDTYQ